MCYFTITSTHSNCTKTAHYPGTNLEGVAFELRKRMTINVVYSRSPKNLQFVHFTLCCRGRQRNVPKFKNHVKYDCFLLLNLFCGIVVAHVPICLVTYSTLMHTAIYIHLMIADEHLTRLAYHLR